METVSTPPRRRRGLRILCCILLVLALAGSVWFFWLPKKLFAFLKADQVEAVWLTWGDSPEILMNREDQEKLVEQLSQVSFEYWVSSKDAAVSASSPRSTHSSLWKIRIILHRDASFFIEQLNGAEMVCRLGMGESDGLAFQVAAKDRSALNEIQQIRLKALSTAEQEPE